MGINTWIFLKYNVERCWSNLRVDVDEDLVHAYWDKSWDILNYIRKVPVARTVYILRKNYPVLLPLFLSELENLRNFHT